jgi:plasmid stabilization system protein ParE
VRVLITPPAKADLFHIGDWIERDSPGRAITFVEELYDACLRLGELPFAFPLLIGHEESGIRRYPYGRYLIFYSILEERIEVLHVLHSARDYVRILFGDE